MARTGPRARSTGFVVGVAVAFAFALVISVLPAALFEQPELLPIVFAAGALAAPPTVWTVWALASWRRTDPTITLVAAGAMTFDGLGIAPRCTGTRVRPWRESVPSRVFKLAGSSSGAALAGVGAMLLFAFSSLSVAGYVMTWRRWDHAPTSN